MAKPTLTFSAATAAGTIELAVSERVAAAADLAAWGERVRRMDEADARRDRRVRAREVPYTDLRGKLRGGGPAAGHGAGILDDPEAKPLRAADHQPAGKAEPGEFDPVLCWLFWVARCDERDPDEGRWLAYAARMLAAWVPVRGQKYASIPTEGKT